MRFKERTFLWVIYLKRATFPIYCTADVQRSHISLPQRRKYMNTRCECVALAEMASFKGDSCFYNDQVLLPIHSI